MTDVNQLITDYLDIWTSAIEKKSSAGRGNGGGLELYGIRKLRKLVFELAVRGKLVIQLAEEGTGSELKEAVLKSRAAAVRSKELRKQKPLPEITEQELLFAVPPSWGLIRLGELTNYGVTDKADADEMDENIWVLELEDVEKVSSKLIKRVYFSERRFKSSKNRFIAGDVIYGKLRPYLDKVLIADEDGVCTTEMIPMRAFGDVSPEFVRLFLKSPEFIRYADDSTHGMNLPRLGTDKARMAVVPLPPLAEQQRIVAKADELMALCDVLEQQAQDNLKAHQTLVASCLATLTNSQSSEGLTQNWTRIEAYFDTLFTTEESVEALRRAALDLALRGLLTDQSKDAPHASDLLTNLYSKNKESASSRHRTIVSKIKAAEPPFDLPESWAWSNLGLLSSDLRYGTSKKCDRDDSLVPVLRIPNVSGGRVDLDDLKFGPLDPKEVDDLRLRPNDLLIIRSNGSLDIVGSFAVVPELEGDFAFAGYLVRVRIDPAFVDPRYIWYVSRSRFLRDQIEGPIRHGVGLKNVNSTELASLQFPIPPREEQEQIVEKLDGLFELCDQFSQRISDQNLIKLSLTDTLTSKIH
ncbi:restriction endonuclease subunit S [Leisingera aquaemixtae]|uniref:restriction endonuclease subunit S n=1 Tax=Leisingera aquaemixtae TaxID=1396826 RepID=UPI0021A7BD16|nr:restriction endonuclease subunit S [Leisingera aquaemixtae]UWQ25379.1 restriction endonuclease subunit S [Leisingera aquaemixtae]